MPAKGRGAGRSTNAFEMVDAIEIAGNALGKVDIVVAHSLGAMATAMAMKRSLKSDRLVLLAPGLRPHQALETFAALLRPRPVVTKAVEHSMADRFGPHVGSIKDPSLHVTVGTEVDNKIVIEMEIARIERVHETVLPDTNRLAAAKFLPVTAVCDRADIYGSSIDDFDNRGVIFVC